MNLSQIVSIIIMSFGAVSLFMAKSALGKEYRRNYTNIVLGITCLVSAVWSYGFAIVFATTNTSVAYVGRSIGMVGVFGFFVMVSFLISTMFSISKAFSYYLYSYSALGIFIYPFTVSKDSTIFYVTERGMTYTFLPGLANNIYTAYSVIFGINIFILIVYAIKKADKKRKKATFSKMLIALILTILGMVVDTVFPLIGLGALPGSTMAQFIAVVVIFYAIVDDNRTTITMLNMSHYISKFVSQAVLVFDQEGCLKLMNESAQNVYKTAYSNYEKQNVHINDIFNLEEDFFEYEGNRCLKKCISVTENLPVEIDSNKIYDRYTDLIGYIITITDMSETKRMMDSLKEAKAQAEDANSAKSIFLANMSHEIRTPLNAILGFSELIIKENESEQCTEQAEDIRNSAQNLLAIINDILDISKLESGRVELLNENYATKDLIKDVYLIINNQANAKKLDFSADIDEKIPSGLIGDESRVRGVLVNILNNAVKYTRNGFVKLIAELVEIDETNNEAVLKFTIKDSGIGIRKEDIPKLFDSFSQVDRKKNSGIEGTGLGLAIVKGYVELMNGSINVESTPGEGSEFSIVIRQKINDFAPIGETKFNARTGETAKSDIGEIKLTGKKVLAVDDTLINLRLLRKVLAHYEMEIDLATSGAQSIERCKKKEYDIILMDQMMPVMDGIEAMNEIRKLAPCYEKSGKCKIIALTANAINGAKEELITKGFDDYISKPVEFDKLNEILAKYLL